MSDARADRQAITEVVRLHVEGMCAADAGRVRPAVHPDACCIGHGGGRLEWNPRESFIAGVAATVKVPDLAPDWHFVSLSRTGDIAVAGVEDVWLGDRDRDILAHPKRPEGWMIVSELFCCQGRA
jgi:hypothetical protein